MTDSVVDRLIGEAPRKERSVTDRLVNELAPPAPVAAPGTYPVDIDTYPGIFNPNPQPLPLREMGRFAVQAPATAAGVVGGGLVGNLPGAILGGMGASAASGQAYDALTGGEPSLGGAALDAATGAVGPLVGPAARLAGRTLSGLSPTVRAEAEVARQGSSANAIHAVLGQGGTRELALDAGQFFGNAAQAVAARRLAGEVAKETPGAAAGAMGSMTGRTATALLAHLATGNIPAATAAWVGAGAAGRLGGMARHAAAEKLLRNDNVLRWLLDDETGRLLASPGAAARRLLAGVGATGAENLGFTLTAEEQDAARTLAGGPDPDRTLGGRQRQGRARGPFDVVLTATGGEVGRDKHTGQFISLEDAG